MEGYRALTAAEKGTALHLVMQYIDFSAASEEEVTAQVESLLEKYKEGAALSDNKEKAFGASYGIKQAESAEKKAPPDIIDEIYVRGKKVQPEQFVDAVVSLLNERTKKEQAET